jgi:DNA-binding CsgD family transcriptional regulator
MPTRTAAADACAPALLQRLYEDVGSGVGLTPALEQIAHCFDARAAHMLALDCATGVPAWGLAADMTQGALTHAAPQYEQHHWRHDPRRRALPLLHPGAAVRCQQVIDEREVRHSEFFQDYFLPLELRWSLVGRLPQAAGSRESVDLALVRDPKRAGFDDAEQRSLERLLPHLRTALNLQSQLAVANTTGQALQQSGVGLVVLDAHLNVVGGTPSTAEQLSAHLGSLPFAEGGSLRFGSGASRRTASRLGLALRACLLDGLPRHVAVQVVGHADTPETAWLTATRRPSTHGVYQIALLVRWPARRSTPTVAMLMALLGLTQREAELGCALLRGETPRQMWQSRKLSAATIRSQLRSLYAKTGVSGQVEFVRLVGSLAA